MQLGYTIPLQRHLKMRAAPCSPSCDLRLCWELHLLRPGGRPSLFAAHASSRYSLLLYDLPPSGWRELPALFAQELLRALRFEGFTRGEAERYFARAGEAEVTKTHGRRPVAFLNRAVDDLYSLPVGVDPRQQEQQPVRLLLNELPCRAAGHDGRGTAREFFHSDLRALLKD